MQSDALGAIKALASNARVRDTLLSGTQFFIFFYFIEALASFARARHAVSGTHFTCYTGTKVPILTAACTGVGRARARPRYLQSCNTCGSHITCFTSTNVLILTPGAAQQSCAAACRRAACSRRPTTRSAGKLLR
jgi:hypothetical protein